MKLYHETKSIYIPSIKSKGLCVNINNKDTITLNKYLKDLPFDRTKAIFLSPYKPNNINNKSSILYVDSSNLLSEKLFVADRSILDGLFNQLKILKSVSKIQDFVERYKYSIISFSEYKKNYEIYNDDYDVEIIYISDISPKLINFD